MGGDYTRMRYSPQTGYIGVFEQQGRVRLDADGNELVEAIDRRRRAECIDTIGFAVFPTDPINDLPTINGFLIAGNGPFTIGQGRGYVDGIQVDCWGSGNQKLQPNLGELYGANPLPFDQQPFYYQPEAQVSPAPFPDISTEQNQIVYLDVWEREVTALEDPGLLEPALGGIDTTTRSQAAWQVKALTLNAPAACTDNPDLWNSLIAPSSGVLSTSAPPSASGPTPCTIDPVSGYTGLENRLFRAQIYAGGSVQGPDAASTATFMWSQENASVAAAITGVQTVTLNPPVFQISVNTVGRDSGTRFQLNDVIEILDDYVEWSIRENGKGGVVATVGGVDPEQLILTVALQQTIDLQAWFNGLPKDINNQLITHPRLRRWDALPAPTNDGQAIQLGQTGAWVTFGNDPAAMLRAGDYWVFYARSATGQVEKLDQAPPRGLHHYARLATITPGGQPQDCRVLWPPPFGAEGCCTVIVNVGDSIQKAIDSLPAEIGGCVCLKAGTHVITQQINIQEKRNIHLHGESIGAVVQNTRTGIALSIGFRSQNITVEDIAFLVTPLEDGKESMVSIREAVGIAIRYCSFDSIATAVATNTGWGIEANASASLEIRGNQIAGCLTGIGCNQMVSLGGELAGTLPDFTVVDNKLQGPITMQAGNPVSVGSLGIAAGGNQAPVTIERNIIAGYPVGVFVWSQNAPLWITANIIERPPLSAQSGLNFGWTDPLGTLIEGKVYAIATDAAGAIIAGNRVQQSDAGHGGILTFGSGCEIRDNIVAGSAGQLPDAYNWPLVPVAIVAYKPAASTTAGQCCIAANKIEGLQNGILVAAEMADLYPQPVIDANTIPNQIAHQVDDILLTQPQNTLPAIASKLQSLNSFYGILTINSDRASILHNIVSACTVGIASISLEPTISPELRVLTKVNRAANANSSLTLPSSNIDGNMVDNSDIGVLLAGTVCSTVQNGMFIDNQAGVALDGNYDATVAQNRSINLTGVVQYLDIFGVFIKMRGNYSEGGQTGILSYQTVDLTIEQNLVITAQGTGIVVTACSDNVRLVNNRLDSCGTTGISAIEAALVSVTANGVAIPFGTSLSAGIGVANCAGIVDIEGCEVRNTGGPDGIEFSMDICVLGTPYNPQIINQSPVGPAHVRVRNSTVVRTKTTATHCVGIVVVAEVDEFDPAFTAIHASGNHVDVVQSGETVIPVTLFAASGSTSPQQASASDILFNDNFVVQRGGGSGVKLTADTVAVTGNRIRVTTKSPSLAITYSSGLTCVGNVVGTNLILTPKPGALTRPNPTTSNVIA
jgi:Family of unknown function (DUF6519)/Periplasmic copper-binding protein (NosD)